MSSDKELLNRILSGDFSPDELFDARPGYDYDWRRKVSDENAVIE